MNLRIHQETGLQCGIHLAECVLCLFKEVKDNVLAEVSIVFAVIHLEDLAERVHVDGITKVGQAVVAFAVLQQSRSRQQGLGSAAYLE